MLDKIKFYWAYVQQLLSLDGGLYIDAFAVCFMVRLLGPLRGYPPVNMAEAGMWSATIAAFAYGKGGGPKGV